MKLYQRVFGTLVLIVASGLSSTATWAFPTSAIHHEAASNYNHCDFNWHGDDNPTGGGN